MPSFCITRPLWGLWTSWVAVTKGYPARRQRSKTARPASAAMPFPQWARPSP